MIWQNIGENCDEQERIGAAKRKAEIKAKRKLKSKPSEELAPNAPAKDNQTLVDIETFIDSPDYLGMKRQVWPGVKEDLIAMSQPGIVGAIIEDGIGGGKSYRVSIKLLYELYRFAFQEVILGEDPRQKYELDQDSLISVSNVSLNAKQAKKVVFGYCSTFVDRSPWFKEYMPRDERISSELKFKNCNYSIFPGHGHQSSVIGLNLLSCVIDEANFFVKAEGANSSGIDYVEEMHDAIESRIRSRFELDGFLGVISSRRVVEDFTARKKRALLSDPDTSRRYFLPPSRASWWGWPERKKNKWRWRHFNHHSLSFDAPPVEFEKIDGGLGGRELFIPETLWDTFLTNPESSLRDHASFPAEAMEPFIRRKDKIIPDWEMRSPIRQGVQPTDWMKQGIKFDELVFDDFFGDPQEWYHFHIDLAKKWDACGIGVVRNSGVDQVAISKGERRPEKAALLDLEFLCQIRAPVGGEIEFATVRRIIYWLRDERGFRFKLSSYDGYQSVDSIQILQKRGFNMEALSVDKNLDPYITFKDALYEGRFFFPPAHGQTKETPWDGIRQMAERGDPMAIFQVELARLELVNGKKVDHPPNGSKDLSDAVAGATTQATRHIRLGRES